MEKPTEPQDYHDDFSSQGDNEKSAFLNSHYVKETARRRGMMYLTFFNLFLFMLSALTLICAVYSQHSKSTYSAAALMDEFGIFCECDPP